MLRAAFKRPLRQAEGVMASVVELLAYERGARVRIPQGPSAERMSLSSGLRTS